MLSTRSKTPSLNDAPVGTRHRTRFPRSSMVGSRQYVVHSRFRVAWNSQCDAPSVARNSSPTSTQPAKACRLLRVVLNAVDDRGFRRIHAELRAPALNRPERPVG